MFCSVLGSLKGFKVLWGGFFLVVLGSEDVSAAVASGIYNDIV